MFTTGVIAVRPHAEELICGRALTKKRYTRSFADRAVAEFGEQRAAELEEFLQTAARQVAEVEQADAHPDMEPLLHS